MDFNSLNGGERFYLFSQSDNPIFKIGIVKGKTSPITKYGTPICLVSNITVSFDGVERTFTEVPVNALVAEDGNDVFSCDSEKMQLVIEEKMQRARNELDRKDYNEKLLEVGSGFIGKINPKYAEELNRKQELEELKKRQDSTESVLKEILSTLKTMTANSTPSVK